MNHIEIDAELLKQISNLTGLLDKEEALAQIDRIIEIGIKSGISSEYSLEEELGLLFDIKYLVAALPFPEHRRVSL